jgi:hypothetical protein
VRSTYLEVSTTMNDEDDDIDADVKLSPTFKIPVIFTAVGASAFVDVAEPYPSCPIKLLNAVLKRSVLSSRNNNKLLYPPNMSVTRNGIFAGTRRKDGVGLPAP